MTVKPVPPHALAHPTRNKDLKTLAALLHTPVEESQVARSAVDTHESAHSKQQRTSLAEQATRQTSLAEQATRQTSLAEQATRQTSLAEQATRQTSLANQALAALRARLKDVLMASTNPLIGKQGAQIRQRILREIVRADLPSASVNHPDLASVVEEIEQYIQSDPQLQAKLAKAISLLQR
jgi:hypothetical protein